MHMWTYDNYTMVTETSKTSLLLLNTFLYWLTNLLIATTFLYWQVMFRCKADYEGAIVCSLSS